MAPKSFDSLYRKASPELRDRLRAFRATHEVKRLSVGREGGGPLDWEYIAGGSGGETILFIHGIGTTGETDFVQLDALGSDFRFVAPSVPAVGSMKEVADGMVAVLGTEGIEKAHVYGVSFGGFAAQALVHHYPERVADLVLSHTALPRASAGRDFDRRISGARFVPGFAYGSLVRAAGTRLISKEIPDLTAAELEFWKANFVELYPAIVTKEVSVGRLRAGRDFAVNYQLEKDGPDGWDGRVLILESAEDSMIRPADREAIKAHYPNAEIFTETRYGHTGTLVRPEASIDHVSRFLSQ